MRPSSGMERALTAAGLLICAQACAAWGATPEQITAESKSAWLILYNADTSGLDADSNGINDGIEWKDWFISTHGISQPRTLGLTDPDGLWHKEWAGMQEDLVSTHGLWTQVQDYLDTGTNGDDIIGILVGYNVPGIWDVYTRDGTGVSSAFRRGAKSVASALAHVTPSPPAPGRSFVSNPLTVPIDLDFWKCGQAKSHSQIPTTGNLTKQLLLDRNLDRIFLTARIDGPSLEHAKDLTRRAIAITEGHVAVRPNERIWQDWVDERVGLPYWSDLGTAVQVAHQDLLWDKFMFDGTTDFDSNGGKECSALPCPLPISPKNDLAWMGFEYNNGWATDVNSDGIPEKTFFNLCNSPVGTRMFALAWISWGGVTLRHRATDPRPLLAYGDDPPLNPDYLTTNVLAWVHSQFSFNALWPDCDGDGVIDAEGGFAAVIASPTCEPGSTGFLNASVFLERVRNGATLAEASLIASPRLQYNYEYVGDPFLKLPRPLPADCNANGVDDFVEITVHGQPDDNENFILDACETDCNFDGLPDACTIARGTDVDCNTNSLPDVCDICSGSSTDCDFNLIPDDCDLAAGTTTDLNTNALPDSCEDCNTNGIPDFLPEECEMFHDFDRDGDSDLVDFAALQRCFGPDPDEPCACAFDVFVEADGVIDLQDFLDFIDYFADFGGPRFDCWREIQEARYAEICPLGP